MEILEALVLEAEDAVGRAHGDLARAILDTLAGAFGA